MNKAQSAATMEATRLHLDLGTKYDGPVDVLGIARRLDLVLMMQPLDNLLGFYVRRPEAAGIVINSRVPESLQRFTLAHEIGHHVLGHEGTTDDRHTLDRFDPDSIVEVQAQAFAAALLMPVPLVNKALRELPATRLGRDIQETDAYLFSRQLGVSFASGVWALYRQGKLTIAKARQFIKRGPLSAKTTIAGSESISNARADVWVLTEENNDLTVLCRVGDEIHVQLSEDTSTGMVWSIRSPELIGFYHPINAHNEISWNGSDEFGHAEPQAIHAGAYSSNAIDLVQDVHRSELDTDAQERPIGPEGTASLPYPNSDGIREVTFVPKQVGPSRVRMELVHPWIQDDDAARSYALDLNVRSRQLAGAGLLAPEPDSWVEEHAATA